MQIHVIYMRVCSSYTWSRGQTATCAARSARLVCTQNMCHVCVFVRYIRANMCHVCVFVRYICADMCHVCVFVRYIRGASDRTAPCSARSARLDCTPRVCVIYMRVCVIYTVYVSYICNYVSYICKCVSYIYIYIRVCSLYAWGRGKDRHLLGQVRAACLQRESFLLTTYWFESTLSS